MLVNIDKTKLTMMLGVCKQYGVLSKEHNGDYLKPDEIIKKFKMANMKMVVLSSDLPDTLLPELERFGLKGLFKEIITNIHDKTDSVPEIIKKHNFNQDETVFIGDSNHEVEAGKKANIKTIAVTWGFSTEKTLLLPIQTFWFII